LVKKLLKEEAKKEKQQILDEIGEDVKKKMEAD